MSYPVYVDHAGVLVDDPRVTVDGQRPHAAPDGTIEASASPAGAATATVELAGSATTDVSVGSTAP